MFGAYCVTKDVQFKDKGSVNGNRGVGGGCILQTGGLWIGYRAAGGHNSEKRDVILYIT